MPHLNNNNKKKLQIISRQDYPSLSLAHLRENKQTNKNSAQISHTEAYTDYQTNLKRAETKRKKEFNLLQGKNSTFLEASDRDLKHKFKKIIMKTQRNIIQMQEQTRNTEIQINEEEIGKLHEKEFKIMIVKMIRNLENKMEKL